MKTVLAGWGNSVAVRIPKSFLDQLGLVKGNEVELVLEKNRMLLKRKKYSYQELLKSYKEMASDQEREKEASLWDEAVFNR